MTSEHWRRENPQFYNYMGLGRSRLDGPPCVEDTKGALLSKDSQSDAHTYLVEISPGWRSRQDAADGSIEFFVLRGDLGANGSRVGVSGYVHLPQGGGGGELTSESGALAVVFWNPNMPSFPPPFTENRTLRVPDLEWRQSVPESHGIMHKPLRLPDPHGDGYEGGPGGHLRVEYMAPGMATPFEHNHHECWEELLLLEGDIFIADEGVMGPGTAVSHPQEWWHGPFATRRGCLFVVHTDAPMGVPWGIRDYPFQHEMCDAYLNEGDWDSPIEQADWADLDWKRFQETPEFRRWAESPDAAEWGDKVGRGAASAFRASWIRKVTGK
jgi:hypothetical protein